MNKRLVVTAALAMLLTSGAAFAQGNTSATGQSGQTGSSAANSQSLPQQIEQKLKSQGFTNVQVVPGSYLVSAKDKSGDPVTMVIGPHSMAVFTAITPDQQTTGSAGKSGSSSSSGSSKMSK